MKSLSLMLSSSLVLPTVMGSSSLTTGMVLVISCPATDEAIEGEELGRNLGIPSNLKAQLEVMRTVITTAKRRLDSIGDIAARNY